MPSSPVPTTLHILKPDTIFVTILKRGFPILFIASAALFIVVILNTFIVQLYTVDGPSMQDTLHTNEQLAVNKLGQTWAHLSGKKYIPKTGDVIVFKKEINPLLGYDNTLGPEYVVKRVIGLPGERVTLKNGVFTVYNSVHPEGFDPDVNVPWSRNIHPSQNDLIDITLEPSELFVSGDNRPESVDSRTYGPIKTENIIGQAAFRVLPLSKITRL